MIVIGIEKVAEMVVDDQSARVVSEGGKVRASGFPPLVL